MRKLLLMSLVGLMFNCGSQKENEIETKKEISIATWRAELQTEKTVIPFNFELYKEEGKLYAQFINDTEKLIVNDVRLIEDSIFIPGYIFESEIQAKIIDSSHIQGVYKRFDTKEPYEIPFEAFGHQAYRIQKNVKKYSFDYTGKWEVTFIHEEDTTKAIGVFDQDENMITGTFLTATGDYRYLKGEIDDNELILSTFDGAHAFVFNAKPDNDSSISGKFYSGKHWEENWTAKRNNSYELPSPENLTYLNEGYNSFEFSFPEIETGKIISSSDDKFKNKVTIIQIMGSWCPNCMDEIVYLSKLKDKFPEIEIVALAFEKDSNFNISAKRVLKVKNKLNANYSFLIAGTHDKKSASKSLPMLNKISSYPTAILINKKGEVVNIHTGFSGPGTGDIYQKFADNYTLKVKKLLSE